MTGNIATDYSKVQGKLIDMDAFLDEIFQMTAELEAAIDSTLDNGWSGIDAEACRVAIKHHLNKIQNSVKWSQELNLRIKNHSRSLYERALKDQNAREF